MNWLKQLFTTPTAPTLSELATGLCVLPVPKQVVKIPKVEKQPDAYIEREETNTWGFRSATASHQQEGSVPELTAFDVELLTERGYWGGKKVIGQNAKAKEMWHGGKTELEAAKALGLSESWVEKRYGTFGEALKQELLNK